MRRVAAGLALSAALAVASCAPTDGPGTRANPMPVGEPLTIGTWEVEVGGTTFDAEGIVLESDPANSPPAPGNQYAMVPVRVTHGGADVGLPWFHLDYNFMGSDGVLYGEAGELCGEIPGSMMYVGEMLPGEVRTANVCVSVPSDAVEGGTWFVRPEGSHPGWTGHFAAQEEGPAGQGSRQDPFPVGAALPVGPYWIALGSADADPATRAEVQVPDDREALLAPVEVTLEGEALGITTAPAEDLRIEFVSADGEVLGDASEDQCAGVPDPLGTEPLPVGETVTGTVCVAVPPDLLDEGTWHVRLASEAVGWTGFVALWD